MPLASVIITVYRRTEFLKECVDSVLNQSGMERSDLEIIVVTNTDLSSIDLDSDKLIFSDQRSIGQKLSIGVNASTSPLIFFLEDDDYFFPSKITTLLPLFQDEKVGYVHNLAADSTLGNELQREPIVERIDSSWLDSQSFFSYSKKFWHYAGGMSCIGIRKNSINVEQIANIQLLPDIQILPMVLMHGMDCIQFNKSLTFYRRHSENTTSSLYDMNLARLAHDEGVSWLKYVAGKSINVEKQARALLLKRSLASRYYSSIVHRNDLINLIQYELASGFFINDLTFLFKNLIRDGVSR